MEKVAKDFPKLQFAIIDSVVNLPNVQSIVFKEHEGSFLVGMMAAMASKTGKVGFVGGMDIPLIRKFQCGFEQGAKYANPKAEVSANMTGTTPTAWNDPARGAELAKAQFAKGVDVIFAAAGGTGVGVYQAAKDAGKLAIGVDSNQNHLHPGTMLTSHGQARRRGRLQRLQGHHARRHRAGPEGRRRRLRAGRHNAKLVSADMKKKVDAAKADIIAARSRSSTTWPRTTASEHDDPAAGALTARPGPHARHRQALRRRAGQPRGRPHGAQGHHPRHRRRERRRQEHADVHPVRLLPGRQGADRDRRQAVQIIRGSSDAIARGVGMVHQHFMLVDTLRRWTT
jgi:hypothetical protein